MDKLICSKCSIEITEKVGVYIQVDNEEITCLPCFFKQKKEVSDDDTTTKKK